jgi:hypothetical protein
LAPDCIHRSTAKKRLLTSASSSSSFLLSFLIETNTIVYQHKLGTNVRKKTQKGGRPHTSQVCIHTIALNVENSFQPVDLQLALPGANRKTRSFWSCQFRPFLLVKTVVCQDRLRTNIREHPATKTGAIFFLRAAGEYHRVFAVRGYARPPRPGGERSAEGHDCATWRERLPDWLRCSVHRHRGYVGLRLHGASEEKSLA